MIPFLIRLLDGDFFVKERENGSLLKINISKKAGRVIMLVYGIDVGRGEFSWYCVKRN
jgi:hypothetical protein